MDENESLGRYLRRERESRKISLREVSKNIKVKEHLLKAIEEDQYVTLPSPTYVKGFLLAYAKYMGLDPNDVLLRYEGGLKGKSAARAEAPSEEETQRNRRYLWIIGGVLVVGFVVSYFLFLRPSGPPVDSVSVKPKIEETLSSPPPPPLPGKPPTHEEQPFSLQLKAVEETWVRIQVDGELEKEMTLKPGETTSHRALKQIFLLVGNAGGLDLIFQGKTLQRFGRSGEVVGLMVTPQGVEAKRFEKLRSKPE